MKHITNITILSLATSFLLLGCTTAGEIQPAKTKKLNSVSATTINKKPGYMQRALDNWLKDDWEPTVQKDPNIQKKYMKKEVVEIKENNSTTKQVKYIEKKERSFTLQELVDKVSAYRDAQPNDYESSHAKQMESMPVIGK